MNRILLIAISTVFINTFDCFSQEESKQYSTFFNEGVKKSGEQNFKEAIDLFNQAIALKSDYSEALFARGQCYLLSNERIKACEDFEKCGKLGLKQAEEYTMKYCGKDSPGRTMKPSAIIQPK